MNTIEFDKKLTCGPEFVAVRIFDLGDEQKYGNIVLPSSYASNDKLAFCQVLDVGSIANEKLGIEKDDYVMIDRLATFAHTAPVAALKYDSVICKTNSTNTEFYPVKDTLFIEKDSNDGISNVGGIYAINYASKLNTGKITKTGFEKTDEYPFEAGQTVMLVKGGDFIQSGEKQIHIIKKDMVVCTIED